MKKTRHSKLHLNRQSLRELTHSDTARVAGGTDYQAPGGGGDYGVPETSVCTITKMTCPPFCAIVPRTIGVCGSHAPLCPGG